MATKPDLSEFFKLSRPKRPPCQIGHALAALKDAAERDALEAACKTDPGIITNSAIRDWLLVRKHDVSVNRIVSHRKGSCTCND